MHIVYARAGFRLERESLNGSTIKYDVSALDAGQTFRALQRGFAVPHFSQPCQLKIGQPLHLSAVAGCIP